jgi:hypothetical protein
LEDIEADLARMPKNYARVDKDDWANIPDDDDFEPEDERHAQQV